MLLGALKAAVCALCLAVFEGQSPAQPSARATATDLSGKAVDPLRESRGKALVLVFVRTDCPVSNRYAPTLKAIGSQLGNGAKVWLVFPARSENAESIHRYLLAYEYNLPALQDRELRLVHLARATITPEAAVFNAKGELVYHGRIDNWYVNAGRSRPTPTTHELSDAIEAISHGRRPSVDAAPAVGCYISDLE